MKQKKPRRVPSPYNIFYSFESERLKRRKNAFVRFHTIFSSGKSQLKLNCTQAIGGKWSKKREEEKEFVLFFELVREEKMQEYRMRKELFFAETKFDRLHQNQMLSLEIILLLA